VKRVGFWESSGRVQGVSGRVGPPRRLSCGLTAAVWTAAWDTAWRGDLVSKPSVRAGSVNACWRRNLAEQGPTIRQATADGPSDQGNVPRIRNRFNLKEN